LKGTRATGRESHRDALLKFGPCEIHRRSFEPCAFPWNSREIMETNKRAAGGLAENAAESFLKSNGYRILERNFYSPFGEIDIIAADGNYTVFVEVKSRNSAGSAVRRTQ